MKAVIERKIDREEFKIETPIGFPNIGMSYCPGRQTNSNGILTRRNSMEDLLRISQWRASLAIALLEKNELKRIGGYDLPKSVPVFGMEWSHCPVMKKSPLRQNSVSQIDICEKAMKKVLGTLRNERKVIVFCDDGLDRTGTFVCRILVEIGIEPEKALRFIGKNRRTSLSQSQVSYIMGKIW